MTRAVLYNWIKGWWHIDAIRMHNPPQVLLLMKVLPETASNSLIQSKFFPDFHHEIFTNWRVKENKSFTFKKYHICNIFQHARFCHQPTANVSCCCKQWFNSNTLIMIISVKVNPLFFCLCLSAVPVRHMAFGVPGGSTNMAYFVLCGGGLTAAVVYVSIYDRLQHMSQDYSVL